MKKILQITNYKLRANKGFTLIEFIIVFIIAALIGVIIIGSVLSFRAQADLSTSVQNVIDKFRSGRAQTIASQSADKWGVHIDSSSTTLFKGASYSPSDSNNVVYNLPATIEIANSSLGLPADIVFERITGKTANFGTFEIRIKEKPSSSQVIKIEASGQVGLSETPMLPLGTRAADYRHIHFIYERPIATTSEVLTITLDGTNTTNLPIANHLDADGHFNWSGAISVGGLNQFWTIHTHYLNDAVNKTVFSIYRGQNNNKSMVLTISGETGVNLISYDAVGIATKGTSIFVLEPLAQ